MKTTDINGSAIAYQQAGSGDRTLLLLHGAFLSPKDWQSQLYSLTASTLFFSWGWRL